MADKKISQLTPSALPLAGTEVLPIVQSGATVKVASNDLTVKNIRSNATTGILQVAGPAAAATRTMTVPDANFTAARTDASNSFTGDQTLATGNLVIGTSGKGIDFSATPDPAGMTSELLDDYEEGTFTPEIYTGITSPTYTEQLGRYTKIGNMVYLQVRIVLSGGTGAGTQLGISGFPYASNANTPNGNGFNGYNDLSTTAIYWYVPQSSSTNVLGYFPGGADATTTGSMAGKSVNINVVYQV